MKRQYRDPSDGSLIENHNPAPKKKKDKPGTLRPGKPGKWNLELMEVKGYCRNCWKKFHQSIQGPIDGCTMRDIEITAGKQIRCCTNPDIRFIPV